MVFVKAEMLYFDLERCENFGKGQQAQSKGLAGIFSFIGVTDLVAMATGYRQLCVMRLIEDMYDKQGTVARRKYYKSMATTLCNYKPMLQFLEKKEVPYEANTVLRRLLRSVGVFVNDFDVRYAVHSIQYIYESTIGRTQVKAAAETMNKPAGWAQPLTPEDDDDEDADNPLRLW